MVTALFRFARLASFPEVIHGISDRTSGSIYPDEAGVARQRLADALGVSAGAFVQTHQVHRAEIVPLPGPRYGNLSEDHGADGLITGTPGTLLLGYFADCVPILAYDPTRAAVGLAHAGWRGTLLSIAQRLVEAMADSYGSHPGDLVVGLGPSIGPCCYEVGEEVIAGVAQWLPWAEKLLRPGEPGHAYLDLWEANRQALIRAGVAEGHIEIAGLCTACRVDRFYSYRRERRLNGLFGAVIGLRERAQ